MFIHLKDVFFSYERAKEEVEALKNINLEIEKGEFVSIVGPNGSGKSTLARLINAINIPRKGDVFINGINTKEEKYLWEIRRKIGMVFQNPDNQIVASVVENDVAFGLENLGFPSQEIRERVDKALSMVGLSMYKKSEPHYLSGGQKQRLAIAGVLAMEPECIVFDEPTSMLDPRGRKEVRLLIRELNEKKGITILLITQDMEEVLLSRRVIALLNGEIVFDGYPQDLFSDPIFLDKLSLSLTRTGELVHKLRKDGVKIPQNIMKREEFVEYLCK